MGGEWTLPASSHVRFRSFTHDYGRGTDDYRRCKVTCLVYILQDDESEHHDVRFVGVPAICRRCPR